MMTVLKLTFANLKHKKFRSVLIILSIVLSVALMYAILSLSSQTTRIFEQKIRKEVGNTQTMIIPTENSGEVYIPELNFDKMSGIEYHIPFVSAYGYADIKDDMKTVMLSGMSEQDYETIYGLKFIERSGNDFTDNQVFIGKETADKYELTLGATIDVTAGGKAYSFIVVGIVEDQNNNLSYELGNLKMIVPENTVSQILNLNNQVSGYCIKSSAQTDPTDLRVVLQNAFPKIQVKSVTDMYDYKQAFQMVISSLLIMVFSVLLVSAFIIYSSFKIIAIDRMPLMGTLRSIGATRKMTSRTILFEAIFYGVMGGIIGNVLGIGILAATMKMMFANYNMSVGDVSYINPIYLMIAMLIGLVLAIGSAVVPIMKVSKRSIRSIIFSEIQNEKHISIVKSLIGALLIVAAFLIFIYAPLKLELPLKMIGILMVIIGAAMIIPMLSGILIIILTCLLKPVYRDRLEIVKANLKNDRTMMNNILLLAVGLGVILMINNFSSTVGVAVTDVYATGKADAIAFYEMDDSFIEQVRELDGVEHVYTDKAINNLKANDGKVNLLYLTGIDGKGYSEYAWDEFGSYLTDDLMNQFHNQRSALLTRFTARKYDLKVGDTLDIAYNGKTYPYKVIGIVPSIMNNGNMTFVYDKFLAEDFGVKNSQDMYVNIKDNYNTEDVIKQIKELLPYGILQIQTLQDMRDQNMKSNNGLFFLMKAISVIAMFIGVVGILNNFTISFLSRKKLMATMRSLGLSKKNTVGNMMLEAFFCGTLGTLCGLLLGTVLIKSMCYVLEAMGVPADVITYNIMDYVFVLISGLVLSMASAILPALSITKENIVTGLRYE